MENKLFMCIICNKEYRSYKSLWNHNKIYHKLNTIENEIIQVKKTYNCKYCNKIYKIKQSKYYHEKKCKQNTNNEIKKNINNEINNLKKNTNLENININININNGIINNTIINSIGKENIRDVPILEIKELIKNKKNDYLIEMLKLTNFNDKIPENHNFCITSLEGKYVSILNSETNKIEKINKDIFFNKMIHISFAKFDDLFFILEMDEDVKKLVKIKYFERLQHQFDKKYNKHKFMLNEKNIKKYNLNINALAYNYKNMILNTWSTLKNNNNNDKYTFENLSDSDSNFSDDTKNSQIIYDSDSNDSDDSYIL